MEPENTAEAREESMQLQLAGGSAAVTADEAAAGLDEARRELSARGAAYGVGFGYVKNFGSPRGLDGIRLEYAVTDGERTANVHVVISGTRLSMLGYSRSVGEVAAELRAWALDALYSSTALIPHSSDRYARLLERHPLHLA